MQKRFREDDNGARRARIGFHVRVIGLTHARWLWEAGPVGTGEEQSAAVPLFDGVEFPDHAGEPGIDAPAVGPVTDCANARTAVRHLGAARLPARFAEGHERVLAAEVVVILRRRAAAEDLAQDT